MSERLAKRVLLIGWDGADWRMIEPLIEKGHMPNLGRFIDRGVMGNVASLTPMLSPILWTSIATGKYGDKHQILGFAEPDGTSGKVRPVTSGSRKCKAVWNILSDRGLKAGVVSWFASHPAEKVNGFIVTDRFAHAVAKPDQPWPKLEHSVHPAELLDEACEYRVHPAQTTQLQVLPLVPRLGEIEDAVKDPKVGELRGMVAHCATTHNVATWLMETQEWDFLGVYYEAIDRFAHSFMEYHPPKAAHLSDEEFERFCDVMVGCYRYHDMMLGRLMQLAGDDTTVIIVSDHGFHSDQLRPEGSGSVKEKPVAWHRPYGVLAITGPGIKKDQRVYGASLLDIAPTVLTLLGCPAARDMDGKPLTQIFEAEGIEPEWIDTYETPGEDGGSVDVEEDPWVAQKMLARLADLGYIENESTEGVVLDRARNLAQIYQATGRPALAIEQFEQVLEKKPDEKGVKMAIASCRLQMGRLDEAEKLAQEVLTDKADAPQANYFMGVIHFRRGLVTKALEHLLKAEEANPGSVELQCQIGNVYLRRRWWRKAEQAFGKALEIDADCAEAHDGLGVAYRHRKRPEEAVHKHMQAIALLHYRPQTHLHLGMALAETGQIDWAIRAFHVALEQNPNNPIAHRCLAQLYRRAKKDPAKAKEHRTKAVELLAARRQAQR